LIMQSFLYRFIRTRLAPGLLWLCLALAAQAEEPGILVLGDSISAAYGMSLEEGWVALLARQLEQYRVINASISGETSEGALRRLPQLLQQHAPRWVIIELGGNDGLRGYPIDRFRNNLEAMVSLSRESGASVILLPMEIPPNYGARYTRDFRDSFVQVAQQADVWIAPFILDGIATNPSLMQADGIHPAVEAQPMMLENVLPAILQALEAS
jgi:acyl-CoA thioesterase-1